jgi:hypothetical protein
MIEDNNLYFEISEGGNYIKIYVLEYQNSNIDFDIDYIWNQTIIKVKAGVFSGQFKADLNTVDFINFEKELEQLYNKLNGIATFYSLEEQISIKVIGDGFGHMNAECSVMDSAGMGNTLKFEINFDQTHIPKILNQLRKIIQSLKIK